MLINLHSKDEYSRHEAQMTKNPPGYAPDWMVIGAHTDFGSWAFCITEWVGCRFFHRGIQSLSDTPVREGKHHPNTILRLNTPSALYYEQPNVGVIWAASPTGSCWQAMNHRVGHPVVRTSSAGIRGDSLMCGKALISAKPLLWRAHPYRNSGRSVAGQ